MKEPKIRFKGFKGEWENTPFSETFDSLKNNSLSRAELSDSGEVMNIHYGDVLIKYGECVDVIKEVETFVKDEEVAKKLHQSCAIKNGDVIFADAAEDNTVGKCSEVIANENDAIVSGLHTIACRPKKDFAPMYLGYYLNSNAYHDQLLPHIQGTKISSISKKAISQTHINSPLEKDEQQSIASYFQHLDSLIQLTTKKIESLKQVKAASLQSMFPQEGETTPRVRFKGFEGEWEKVRASNVFKTFNEKNRPDLPVLSATQDRGMVNRESIGYNIFHDKSNEATYKHILPGQFIIHLRSFQGGFAHSSIEGIASPAYTIMEFKDKTRHFDLYWKYIFVSKEFIKRLELITYGIRDGRSISFEEFSEMYFTVPSYEEQKKIASYITTLDRQITLHTQRLEKLKQIKTACLDEMFV